jgi:subtilisin family serine protease
MLVVALLAAASLFLPSSAPATVAPRTESPAGPLARVAVGDVIRNRWVVGLASTSSRTAAIRGIVGAGGSVLSVSRRGTVLEFEASESAAQKVAESVGVPGGVRYVQPLVRVSADFTPTDSDYPRQWGLPIVSAPAAWDATLGSSAVVIAIVDTGVQLTHPDLAAHIDTANDYDFVNADTSADDDYGHGTHVAGIAAALANGSYGVGVAPGCTILPVKVLDKTGSGSDYDCGEGITWAADHGADVINCSFRTSSYSSAIADAVAYALSKDVVVVAAAGNDGTDSVGYPAALPGVVAVAATDSTDTVAYFSDYGPDVDIAAPGVGIVSTGLASVMTTMSGTSMASPFVAGAAALVRSVFPDLSQAEVVARLEATAVDLGEPGRDDHYGYGRLNIGAALDSRPPTTTSDVVSDYVGAATIHLSAEDEAGGSGVAHTYHAIDDGPVGEGSALFVNAVGAHILTFWSVDAAGNAEAAKHRSFVVLSSTSTVTPTVCAHGTISPAKTVAYGADATFTVTPDAGYHVARVFLDASSTDLVPSGGVYTVERVTADHVISATFAPDPIPTRLTITSNHSTVHRGRAVTLSGAISPDQANGAHIAVYAKRPGGHIWIRLATRHTYGRHHWSYAYHPATKGTWYFQARFGATSKYRASTSSSRKITVR